MSSQQVLKSFLFGFFQSLLYLGFDLMHPHWFLKMWREHIGELGMPPNAEAFATAVFACSAFDLFR